MTTALSLPYSHSLDFEKGIDQDGPYYNVNYFLDTWTDSDTIANELMGFAFRSGGVTYHNLPHQHPLSPNLYCKGVRILGQGTELPNSNGYPSYDGGFMVVATYRSNIINGPYQTSDDPTGNESIDPSTPILWCTQEVDFSTQTVGIPNHGYSWFSDGKKAGIPLQVEVGLTVMKLTFMQVPYIPMPVFRSCRGRTNSKIFLGSPINTVRFKGATTLREINNDGSIARRVAMVFEERDNDWNMFLRKDGITWDTIVDGSANTLYKSADLNILINI